MALRFQSATQEAIDAAKRALAANAPLDIETLLSAVYYATSLNQRYPELHPYLDEIRQVREEPPEKVPTHKDLQAVLATLTGPDEITPDRLFRALAASDAGVRVLEARGLDKGRLDRIMRWASSPPESDGDSGWRESSKRREAIEALNSFGRMLTVGRPDPKNVVGMERQLEALIRTLTKMKRRNVIITGPPGTGKSALVYELASRLSRGDPSIPRHLREHDIFELSPAFLRSGASMVGQYDERVKALITILEEHPRIILFVDEIHSLLQSGLHEKTPYSQANESLKAALGQGRFACIGCTTTAEYRHYIEPDDALTRRFGQLRIEPPSVERTIEILRARRERVEAFYDPLRIPDAILDRTVQLTEEYLPARYQPDKSIQLLDDACAYCVTSDPPADTVGEEALWRALEDMTGHPVVPVGTFTEEDVSSRLRNRILGQDETLKALARAFVAGLGGWSKSSAPRGVFMFCGPTGVGKTETAILLAEILGGGRDSLVRVDCNTLQGSGFDSKPAINTLLGPPPGYVGYVRGQGGLLAKVRDHPQSIVLFDEIEKADPGVAKLLLQILDDGRVEDAEGNPLDFRRSFIVFTTNAGVTYEGGSRIGYAAPAKGTVGAAATTVDSVRAALRARGIGEEFLGRIRDIFIFNALDRSVALRIVAVQLDRLRHTAELRGHRFKYDPEVVPHLTQEWQPTWGVRHLTTVLRHRVTEQLGVAEAQGLLANAATILLRLMPGAARAEAEPGRARHLWEGDTFVIEIA